MSKQTLQNIKTVKIKKFKLMLRNETAEWKERVEKKVKS